MLSPILPKTQARLKGLAAEFQSLAPWNWMCEGDVFGVEFPEAMGMGYCVVRGASGGTPGLVIYREGLGRRSYERSFYKDTGGTQRADLLMRNCLALSFDLSVSGLPEAQFMDYSDGWEPWGIETELQAKRLMYAIEQCIVLAKSLQVDEDMLNPPILARDHLFVRRLIDPGDPFQWRGEWQAWRNDKDDSRIEINSLYVRSHCLDLPQPRDTTWWIQSRNLSQAVIRPGKRPYYPVVFKINGPQRKRILLQIVLSPGDIKSDLQSYLIEVLLAEGYRPSRICLKEDLSLHLLTDWARILNIKVIGEAQYPERISASG